MSLFIENLYLMHIIPNLLSVLKADPVVGIGKEYVLYDVESLHQHILKIDN